MSLPVAQHYPGRSSSSQTPPPLCGDRYSSGAETKHGCKYIDCKRPLEDGELPATEKKNRVTHSENIKGPILSLAFLGASRSVYEYNSQWTRPLIRDVAIHMWRHSESADEVATPMDEICSAWCSRVNTWRSQKKCINVTRPFFQKKNEDGVERRAAYQAALREFDV